MGERGHLEIRGAAVHRHILDRMYVINDYFIKNKSSRISAIGWTEFRREKKMQFQARYRYLSFVPRFEELSLGRYFSEEDLRDFS